MFPDSFALDSVLDVQRDRNLALEYLDEKGCDGDFLLYPD